MSQDDINKDLGHYLHEKKKERPFWTKVFNAESRSKAEVQDDIRHDIEKIAETENLKPEDKQELEKMEEKIETVNKIEEEVEEKIEVEHENALKKFFKKLRSTRKESEEVEEYPEHHEEHTAGGISEEEMRDFLKRMHHWITQLPQDSQIEFKNSDDFKIYTKILKKYDLIK